MKLSHVHISITFLLTAWLLSACSSNFATSPSQSSGNTSLSSSAPTPPTASPTASPTATPTPTPTATPTGSSPKPTATPTPKPTATPTPTPTPKPTPTPTPTPTTGGSAPSLIQHAIEQTSGTNQFENNSIVTLANTTKAGGALWVVATKPNDQNGVGTVPGTITVVDCTQSNFTGSDCNGSADKFQQLNELIDNPLGEQSVAQFAATNITAGVKYIVVHWEDDNYKGVLVAEVGNATTVFLVGSNAQMQNSAVTTTTNAVSSGNITVGSSQSEALLLSLSMDTYGGFSDTGGDDTGSPIYGSSFTGIAEIWNWSTGDTCKGVNNCNTASFESKVITASGSYSGEFTAQSTGAQLVTFAAIFH